MSSIVRKKIWVHGGLQRKENLQKKTKEENDTENKQVLSLKAQTLNEKKKKLVPHSDCSESNVRPQKHKESNFNGGKRGKFTRCLGITIRLAKNFF